jgi:hypothetical protein
VQESAAIDPRRLVVVSRGGAALWYGDLAGGYVDLFDHLTPEQFRAQSEQRMTEGLTKPRTMTTFDRETIKLTRQTLRLGACDVLHPMQMYRLFQAYWQSRVAVTAVEPFLRWQPIALTNTSEVSGALPDQFIAARFQFNETFPDTESNRRFAISLLNTVADTSDVVLLYPPLQMDDYSDLSVAARGRIHDVSHLLSARTALDVHTKVIARARAFIGSAGGLSYLPPLLGVPSVSFFSTSSPAMARHVELARRAFGTLQAGSYVTIDVNDLDALRAGLGDQYEAIAQLARARRP